jgi:hypothetical protein
MLLLIECLDCGPSSIVIRHFHKSKTFAAARVTILNHLSTSHRAKGREKLLKACVCDVVAKVTNIQFRTHYLIPSKKSMTREFFRVKSEWTRVVVSQVGRREKRSERQKKVLATDRVDRQTNW